MESLRKVFASRLKEFRAGRTQAEFAEHLDISLRTYQELEAGNIPQAKTLAKLVERLDLKSETVLFFDRDLVAEPSPQEAWEIVGRALAQKPTAPLPEAEDFDEREMAMLRAAVDAIREQRSIGHTSKKRENHS